MSHATVESRLDAIERRLESLGKPPTSELDELRGKLAAALALAEEWKAIAARRNEDIDVALGRAKSAESRLAEAKESVRNHDAALNKACGRADKAESALAASEQAREGMARIVEAAMLWRLWTDRPMNNESPKGELVAAVDAFRALASPPAKKEAGIEPSAFRDVEWKPGVGYVAAPPQAETGREDALDVHVSAGPVVEIRRVDWGADASDTFAAALGWLLEFSTPGPFEGVMDCVSAFRVVKSQLDTALATVSHLTSERDAAHRDIVFLTAERDTETRRNDELQRRLEAAGALEKPEDAWRRGAMRTAEKTLEALEPMSVPYEPPTGATAPATSELERHRVGQ